MTSNDVTSASSNGLAAFLSRERIIARPGFNRWLVPPAALAIHLCIGMAYGFSVFWLPLSRAVGITESIACSKACVGRGGEAVFVVGDKVMKFDDASKAKIADFIGQKVQITGDVKDDTVTVASIKAAAE